MNITQLNALSPSERGKITSIPLPLIKAVEAPSQARYTVTSGDKRSKDHIKNLAYDIKTKGQQVPVTVEPNGDGTYTMVAGNHRLEALQMNDKTASILAYVKQFTSPEKKQNWQDRELFDKTPDLAATADDAFKSALRYIKSGIFGPTKGMSQYDAQLITKIKSYMVNKTGLDGRTAASAVKRALKHLATDEESSVGSADIFTPLTRATVNTAIQAQYRDTQDNLVFNDMKDEDEDASYAKWIVGKPQDIKNHVANTLYRKIRKGFTGKCILFVYVEKLYDVDWKGLDKERIALQDEIDSINNDRTLLNGPLWDEVWYIPQKHDSVHPERGEDKSRFLSPAEIRQAAE
jgi:hypothetical protein